MYGHRHVKWSDALHRWHEAAERRFGVGFESMAVGLVLAVGMTVFFVYYVLTHLER